MKLVALRQIAAHVDFVFEDVGEGPSELVSRRGRENTRPALVQSVVETRVNYADDRECIDELGVRGSYDERREQEISRLKTWLSDHNRLHREDLLLLEGGVKPYGDQSKGRYDSIANWS